MKKEQILKLRGEGKTYREIAEILKCSTATVQYNLKPEYRRKAISRSKKRSLTHKYYYKNKNKNRNKIKQKLNCFLAGGEKTITYEQLMQKLQNNPYCYLTGRRIDLSDDTTFEFDHIIPRTKGGSNSVENLGLLCKDANRAKHNMLLEDFIKLCNDIVEYNKNRENNEKN